MENIKLYGMTLVYNESVMIPYLMPYYERLGFDKLIVYDNESTDNTVELLSKFPFVEIRTFKTNKKENAVQSKLKSEIFKEFSNIPNCWMYISDFDEVIYYDGNFKEYLSKKNEEGYTHLNQEMLELLSDKFPNVENGHLVHEYTERGTFWPMGFKTTLFKVCDVTAMKYTPGAHRLTITANYIPKTLNDLDIRSFHIKYIDYDFILRKNKLAAERRSDDDKRHGYGTQYDKLKNENSHKQDWEKRKSKSIKVSEYLNGHIKGLNGNSKVTFNNRPTRQQNVYSSTKISESPKKMEQRKKITPLQKENYKKVNIPRPSHAKRRIFIGNNF